MTGPRRYNVIVPNKGGLDFQVDPNGQACLWHEVEQYILRLQRAYEQYGAGHLASCRIHRLSAVRLSDKMRTIPGLACDCGWLAVVRGEV